MTENDVTPEQAKRISAWLTPAMLKLAKLHERMRATFPSDDPLLAKASAAHEAARVLRLALHEIDGKGRPYPPR